MTKKLDVYPTYRLQQLGTIVVVQPTWKDETSESLTCDLETGTVALAEHPRIQSDYTDVFGVLGLARLEAGPALIVITGIEEVATLRGYPLYKITSTKVLADFHNGKWKAVDHHYLKLIRLGTDPKAHAGSLFFSHGGDPTLNQQAFEASNLDKQSMTSHTERADDLFFWNKTLAAPLLEAGVHTFVPTAFLGFAKQLNRLEFASQHRSHTGTITLIARRSVYRAGCRQWRRGVDMEGNIANFAETEQIVCIEGQPSGPVYSSFVQVRGSIPLLWSQSPNLKYKIPIRIGPHTTISPVFAAHIDNLLTKYGRCVAVNLANQTGREGKLSAAYAQQAADLSGRDDFRLVHFDFHKHCGATNYSKLNMLWNDISSEITSFGYWFQDGAGTSAQQAGVFRVNCVDSLDRTNVVAGGLARKQLEHMLVRLGVLPTHGSLAANFPEVDRAFRVTWADHGDELSQQYAGTGAMKSAFTRTGKRDLAGLIDDGQKSLTRYFLNNFRDGVKQDALDLVTGTHPIVPGKAPTWQNQGSPALPLIAALAAVWLALKNASDLSRNGSILEPSQLFTQVAVWLVAAILLVRFVLKNGSRLVDRPQLRPDLVIPWES